MDMSALTKMLSGAGDFIQKSPEKFAVMADTIGSNIAPNNPFAGVGTAMGKSSLANKAREGQQKQLSDLLAGTGATQQGATPKGKTSGSQLSLLDGMDLSAFTDAGQAGPTSMTIKAQPDGSQVATTNHTVQTPGNRPNTKGVNLADVVPFSNALAGEQQQDLTGLDPALIAQIMARDLDVADLKSAKAASLGASAIAQNKALVEQQKLAQKQQMNESLIGYRELQGEKISLENRLAEAKAPSEISKMKAELSKLTLDMDETAQDISTKQLANEDETARQEMVNALSGDVTPGDLSTQGKLGLYGQSGATSLENAANTTKRLEIAAASKAKVKRTEVAYEALANINSDDVTDDVQIGAVDQWNKNSPDDATFGYFIGTSDDWGPGNDERGDRIKVELPTGMSMGWIRQQAKAQGVSVDSVLEQLRKEMKGE